MKKKNITSVWFAFAVIAVMLLVTTSACSQKKKPADLPQLYPCEITVIQDGQPLEGAIVGLIADGHNTRFPSAAISDNKGIAKIKTDSLWPGAPAGNYKVTISKTVLPVLDLPKEIPDATADPKGYAEYRQKVGEMSGKTKSVVDQKFLRPNSTPESIEVTSSGYKGTIDVGAAVDELWENVSRSSGAR